MAEDGGSAILRRSSWIGSVFDSSCATPLRQRYSSSRCFNVIPSVRMVYGPIVLDMSWVTGLSPCARGVAAKSRLISSKASTRDARARRCADVDGLGGVSSGQWFLVVDAEVAGDVGYLPMLHQRSSAAMPAASFSSLSAAPSMGLIRAPVANARSTSRSVSRGSGVPGRPFGATSSPP
jgi:hypothetical protein